MRVHLPALAAALASVPAAWGGAPSEPSEQPAAAVTKKAAAGSGHSAESETSPCVDLGNNCWRTRYADSDNNYGNNDQCSIPLPSPLPARITVHRFSTEPSFDKLMVDGVPYSGGTSESPHAMLVHNSLTWSTDGSITNLGWHICLVSLATGHPTGSPAPPTGFPTRESSHCVSLGNDCWRSRYVHTDSQYGNGDHCSIPVPGGGPRSIVVHRFDTEIFHDWLLVAGVQYSGSGLGASPNGVTVHGNLIWNTDATITRSGWHLCLVGPPTAYPTTEYPTSPTGWPTEYPTSPTGFPSDFPAAVTGFPTRTGFPSRSPSGYPSGFPSRGTLPPGSVPVRFSSCMARPGKYTVDGVQRDSPCHLSGRDRHVDYVGSYGDSARLYTCSAANRHHFVLCTCSGATCVGNEEPRTCFVAQNNGMGCVGMLRGAVFSSDGTKAFFACNKEVRVCRVDLGSRNGNWYSHCQVLQNAGCPRWAGIRGVATRQRPNRGDLLVVVCTDWKTRACSLDSGNMQMQPGRQCVKGGRETVCNGIGKPSGLSFNADNKLLVPCDDGYSYSKFVGGIVQDITHTAYVGVRPCPAETNAVADLGSGRVAVACGPDGVRECQIQYS